MIRALFEKLANLGRRNIGSVPCPEIRWDDVERIEASGMDMDGVFEVTLIIFHADGTEVTLTNWHRGHDSILETLSLRYPTIPPDWFDQMAAAPGHVYKTLYSRN